MTIAVSIIALLVTVVAQQLRIRGLKKRLAGLESSVADERERHYTVGYKGWRWRA